MLSLILAAIITGEAGICDLEAQLAVAWVWHNRQTAGIVGGWYGYAEPSPSAIWIAEHYDEFDDPTNGAIFLVSSTDLTHWTPPGVQTWQSSRCANGDRLHAWRAYNVRASSSLATQRTPRLPE